MKLSGYKLPPRPYLFDMPVPGHAHARNIAGDLCEELTAMLFNGRRHRTDSRADYCPDVSVLHAEDWADGELYIESKSAGLSRQTFIYSGRLAKDEAFARDHRLYYCIWHHRAATKQAKTEAELRSLLLSKMQCAYVVPFGAIKQLCELLNAEPLNSAYGGTDRAVYGSGYRINLSLIEQYRILEWKYDKESS